jgi:death-on-curing protein
MHWLSIAMVHAIHFRSLRDFGGAPGVRDDTLLLSAIGRPRNLAAYSRADIFRLAAAYAYGICKNHPFIDGNKRTSFMSAYVFLRMNDYTLATTEEEAATTFLELAAGKVSETKLAAWLRRNSTSAKN